PGDEEGSDRRRAQQGPQDAERGDPAPSQNAGDLHRLARLLREVAQAATANAGERPPAASTVAIVEDVAEHPDAPIKDIVARTGLAQSLVSRTVDQLQRRGVLKVARDPADGRRSLVRINPRIRRG